MEDAPTPCRDHCVNGAIWRTNVGEESNLASATIRKRLRQTDKNLAVRADRTYRTVFEAAAGVLTGMPP